MGSPSIVVLRDPAAVAAEGARRVEEFALEATAARGRFVLVLSGGSTPRALYELLSSPERASRLPWSRTILLFGDERCVPPDHPESNYRMVEKSLLRRLSEAPGTVLRIEGEDPDPSRAAARYEARLREAFPGEEAPPLDLVLLGMGPDGHTASLFPGTAAVEERSRWVAVGRAPSPPVSRITLTLPALGGARRVLFLITGAAKSRVVAEAFGGLPHPARHPCERVAPRFGAVEVLLDEAAAGGAFAA